VRHFLFHKWKPVAVEHMYRNSEFRDKGANPFTRILLKCECGAFTTRELDSHWNLEDLIK